MKISFASAIIMSCILFACKESKQTAATTEVQPKVEVKAEPKPSAPVQIGVGGIDELIIEQEEGNAAGKVDANAAMPFIVSFYSTGEGIDRGFPEKLLAFVESYGNKIKSKIEFSEIHWGREGETDYCFPLSGMQDSGILNFKSGVKDALKGGEHVHFLENQPCRKGR